MVHVKQTEKNPTVYITKNKQRVKQYEKTVFLENGEEFELELFNPTSNKILAKITLNGNPVGNGLVLRPGERVFLERYLESAKKFLFETYEVDSKDSQSLQAIQNNGKVEVEFYQEDLGAYTYYNLGSYTFPNPYAYGNSDPLSPTWYSSDISYIGDNVKNVMFTTNNINTDFKKDSIETGRVEEGSKSNQQLDSDFSTYRPYFFHTVTWQILPKSRKVVTKEELKVYCTKCGVRRKKTSYKYCPHCGGRY